MGKKHNEKRMTRSELALAKSDHHCFYTEFAPLTGFVHNSTFSDFVQKPLKSWALKTCRGRGAEVKPQT
jgi:hypothetical protein